MKKRFIWIGGIAIFLIVLTIGIYLFSEPGAPDVPDYEALTEIQLNSVVVDAKRLQEEWTKELLAGIETARPIQRIRAGKIKNDEDFYVIALIDENGNRTCLHFFEYEENVYMTADHKNVYTDVGFVSDLIDGWNPTGWGWGIMVDLRVNVIADPVPAQADIKGALETGYDARNWLSDCVSERIEQGMSEEEALESGAEYMLAQYKIYQYAVENGYGIPDGFYQQLIETAVDHVKARENYAEIDAQYKAAGTTFEEYVAGYSSYLWKITDTVDYMNYCIRTQFREGNYTVNDVSYYNAEDYCNAYINDVVMEKLDKIDAEEFAEELEIAKQYVSAL